MFEFHQQQAVESKQPVQADRNKRSGFSFS